MKKVKLFLVVIFISLSLSAVTTNSGNFNLRLMKTGSDKVGFCKYEDAYNDNPDELAVTVVDFTLAEQSSGSETNVERATAEFGVFWDVYSGEESQEIINLTMSFSASADNMNEAMLVNTELENSVLNYNVSAAIKDSKSDTSDTTTQTITVADSAITNPHPGLNRDIMLISNEVLGPYSQIKGGAKVDLELLAPSDSGSFMGGYYSGYIILTLDTK